MGRLLNILLLKGAFIRGGVKKKGAFIGFIIIRFTVLKIECNLGRKPFSLYKSHVAFLIPHTNLHANFCLNSVRSV